MTLMAVLEGLAVLLATIGLGISLRLVFASIRAQRDWRRAMRTDDRARAIAEQAVRQRDMSDLAEHLRSVVRQLEEQHALSQQSAEVIEAALLQPSAVGRRAYADKLAREASHSPRLVAH